MFAGGAEGTGAATTRLSTQTCAASLVEKTYPELEAWLALVETWFVFPAPTSLPI